jgi:hypothetical protein
MNGDTILYWMTHLAEGSWQAFKDAVARLAPDDDAEALVIPLRYHLSDLAHADFFIDGSRRWRVRPPVLAGLADAGGAVLVGGHTPTLVEALMATAERLDSSITIESNANRPSIIRVSGDATQLNQIAEEAGVRFSAHLARTLCSSLRAIPQNLDRLPRETPPTNWMVRSFDFDSMSMIDGLHRNSACEYRPRRGLPRWYVHTRRARLTPLAKRDAIYAAAAMQGVPLLTYEPENQRLAAKRVTLPPEPMVRVACLCAGQPARVDGDRVYFDHVPHEIGALLCAAAGQALPKLAAQPAPRSGQ